MYVNIKKTVVTHQFRNFPCGLTCIFDPDSPLYRECGAKQIFTKPLFRVPGGIPVFTVDLAPSVRSTQDRPGSAYISILERNTITWIRRFATGL